MEVIFFFDGSSAIATAVSMGDSETLVGGVSVGGWSGLTCDDLLLVGDRGRSAVSER